MKKMYLISWSDDNHDPHYWLNEEYLGVDINVIVNSVIRLGLPKDTYVDIISITADDFPENIWEELFDYFQTIPKLDVVDIKLITMSKWEDFYEKNIKKIRRKTIDK